jgi:GTPase
MSTQDAFENEMCANGYSDGNPGKNGMVSGPIQKGLTPLYLAMAEKIQSGAWKKGKLSKTLCKSIKLEPTKLTCKKSKDFFAGNL